MIHRATHTYFIDLGVGDNFGEIGFFTDNPRLLSAKSRDYCELYCINKRDFIKIAEDYMNGIVIIAYLIFIASLSYDQKCPYWRRKLLCY